MPLALPFNGVAPLLLDVVFHPFELGHTAVERKVLVESLELHGEVSLLIAPSPMAVLLQPCIGTVQEFPTAFLGRNADDREFALGIDPADVLEAQELEGAGLAAIGGRALAGKPPTEQHPGLVRRQLESKRLHTVTLLVKSSPHSRSPGLFTKICHRKYFLWLKIERERRAEGPTQATDGGSGQSEAGGELHDATGELDRDLALRGSSLRVVSARVIVVHGGA